jgi:hypothetical protein
VGVNTPNRRQIAMGNPSLTRNDLIAWANESVAFYELALTRISTVLLAQCYAYSENGIFSVFDLTDTIKALERPGLLSMTANETQFRHPPLAGLYKKHFFSARFIARNLGNFLKSRAGGKYFNQVWEDAIAATGSTHVDEAFLNFLTYHTVIAPYEKKSAANEITGEWIIFHKHDGANYYLTVGFHDEGDDVIYERVSFACDFDQLPFRI